MGLDVFMAILHFSELEKIPTNRRKLFMAFFAARAACPLIQRFCWGETEQDWLSSHRATDGIEEHLFTLSMSSIIDHASFTRLEEYVIDREALEYSLMLNRDRFTNEEWESCKAAAVLFAQRLAEIPDGPIRIPLDDGRKLIA